MAKRAKPRAVEGAEVKSYRHKEAKRKNIPTAELQKLVPDDDKAIKKLRWPRNPDLDPQLVWRGKDFEPDPLAVDVPPIYIQEKILPRAIIEDLRKQTQRIWKNCWRRREPIRVFCRHQRVYAERQAPPIHVPKKRGMARSAAESSPGTAMTVDPYDGLKRALKAEIDETAWAELNSTISRPFRRPEHGRICVKVINHFGDEVQKVLQV